MHARPHNGTTELDALHAVATDRATDIDRDHAETGERGWRRLALPHEMCFATGRCTGSWPILVDVIVLGDGVRMRMPVTDAAVAS